MAEEKVPVSSLLDELRQTIEPQLQQHGVVLAIKDKAAGAVLAGSHKALAGALLNLLENAMQACVAGGEIQLEAQQAGDEVLLSVSDSGRGMDAATHERLFQPFFTTRTEGTGLGLAIVRGVVETHGGRIEVESVLGEGSKFSIWLPKIKL